MSISTQHSHMTGSAVALGRLLVVIVAFTLITVGIVTANGTVWPALAAAAGIALMARLRMGRHRRCPMSAPEPLTAEHFVLRYDEHKTFPFFEDEDARIWGYGHPDKAVAAAQVADYYRYTVGEDVEVDTTDAKHQWAVRVEPFDDPAGEFRFAVRHSPLPRDRRELGPIPVTADTPGAFPVWTVSL